MPEAVDLGYAVKLPPRRALRYFRSKDYHITGDWWELQKAAHAKAFTVAHAARTDILQSIRRQLTRGLQHGVSEAEFLRNMEPNLKQLGWWGKQVIVDKDGGAETVQLGSPQRLKTIFRTNMRTAYAHGRYRQQLENAEDRPYWQYNARNDARTRASHAALDKVVFRYDDPFWDSHYPPNGFNCRCRVRALTRAQVNAGGLTVADSRGRLHTVTQDLGVDKRTGEVITAKGTAYRFHDRDGRPRTLLPDPGWSYNPGKAQTLYDSLGDVTQIDNALPGQPGWRELGLPARLPVTPGPAPVRLPKAKTGAAQLQQFRMATAAPDFEEITITRGDGKRDVLYNRVHTPASTADIYIPDSFVRHVVLDHPRGNREQFAHLVLPTLKDPAEVWVSAVERGERTLYRRQFLAAFDEKPGGAVVVVQEHRDGGLAWTFYAAGSNHINRLRAGHLLYRRPEKAARGK